MIDNSKILNCIRKSLNEVYKIKGPWYVRLIEELIPKIKNVKKLFDELNSLKKIINLARNEDELNQAIKNLFRKDSGYYDELIRLVKNNYHDQILNSTDDMTKFGENLVDEGATLEKVYKEMDLYYQKITNGSYLGEDLGETIKMNSKKNVENYSKTQKGKRYQKVRPIYAKGMEHKIFFVRSYPNSLFKVGDQWNVEFLLSLFNSSPEIFPKVFRAGKLKNSNQFYLQLEKLDTLRFEKEWQFLENKLQELNFIDEEGGIFGKDLTDIWIYHRDKPEDMKKIYDGLKKYDQKAYQLMSDYFNLFNKCEKSIHKVRGMKSILDVHRFNFGYDKNGILKCLDP